MSLNQSVYKAVNDAMTIFIGHIADKYNLDATELMQEWNANDTLGETRPVVKQTKSKTSTTSTVAQSINEIPSEITEEYLLTCKKPELQALCRQKGVKCTGTKAELIALLLGGSVSSTPKSETTKKPTVNKKDMTQPVLKTITKNSANVPVRRNAFGNFEHAETSLIFDKNTRKAIGRQSPDGRIVSLTSDDIDICKQLKFDYILPENLDTNTKLSSVKVDELDEDIDEYEEEDVDQAVAEDEEIIEDDDEEIIEEEDIIEEELLEEDDEDDEDEDIEYEDDE